jgi:hypothetical protein
MPFGTTRPNPVNRSLDDGVIYLALRRFQEGSGNSC